MPQELADARNFNPFFSGCFSPGLSCPAAGMSLKGFSRPQLKLLQKQPVLVTASLLAQAWGTTKQPDLERRFQQKKKIIREKNPNKQGDGRYQL